MAAGRPRKPDKEKLVSVGLSIHPLIDEAMNRMADETFIIKGTIARMIFMRGWVACERDGLLKEPVAELVKTLRQHASQTEVHGQTGTRKIIRTEMTTPITRQHEQTENDEAKRPKVVAHKR